MHQARGVEQRNSYGCTQDAATSITYKNFSRRPVPLEDLLPAA
ncbi:MULTISPECIES: hypothetical protein [Cyanophyceae]|nr:hypothetical protein [Trichocoleus sp. FACHB-69]